MNSKLERILKGHIKNANLWWQLFAPQEKVLLGISGGKDSLALLELLQNFELQIEAVHLQLGDKEPDSYHDFCRTRSDFHILKTDIWKEAFATDANKNPCFICMRRRRRAIVEFAHSRGIKTIVYGHHRDDVVETLLLNQLYGREISTMLPKQPLLQGEFHIVRPLYTIPQKLLISYAREKEIPYVENDCPAIEKSRRLQIRRLLNDLEKANPKIDIRENLFNSLKKINLPFIPKFPDSKILAFPDTKVREKKFEDSKN
jgi:tRNA 2-thiocytidine biosynthesis protein TtcA